MTFEDLLNSARHGRSAIGASGTRVTVQVGQCSQAVGADAVADAMREALALRDDCYLVLSGCDGACFAAPQVMVQESGGATRYYSRVAASDVPAIAADIGAGHIQRPTGE
ncbi:MAG: (2Fe-2S) ferredoxin domain-containing protein, partial [Chloroflexota bacterium]|nr:(2Fe-2S) ferredoxin domain-containing protein [Chloroflexota bacterium]